MYTEPIVGNLIRELLPHSASSYYTFSSPNKIKTHIRPIYEFLITLGCTEGMMQSSNSIYSEEEIYLRNRIILYLWLHQVLYANDGDVLKQHNLSTVRQALNLADNKILKSRKDVKHTKSPVVFLSTSSSGMTNIYRLVAFCTGEFPKLLGIDINPNNSPNGLLDYDLKNTFYNISVHNPLLTKSTLEQWANKGVKIILAIRDPIEIHIVNYFHLRYHQLPWLNFKSDEHLLGYYKWKKELYSKLPIRDYVLQINIEKTLAQDELYLNYVDKAWKDRDFIKNWNTALNISKTYPKDLLHHLEYKGMCNNISDTTLEWIKFSSLQNELFDKNSLDSEIKLSEGNNPYSAKFWDFECSAYRWLINPSDYLDEKDINILEDRYSFLYDEFNYLGRETQLIKKSNESGNIQLF